MAHQHAREFCLATQCFPKCCVNRHLNTADAPPCDLSISVLLSLAQDACAWAARGRGKEDFHSGSGLLHFSTLYDCALHEGHESALKSSPPLLPTPCARPRGSQGLQSARACAPVSSCSAGGAPFCNARPAQARAAAPLLSRTQKTWPLESPFPHGSGRRKPSHSCSAWRGHPLSASPRSPTSLLHLFMSPA